LVYRGDVDGDANDGVAGMRRQVENGCIARESQIARIAAGLTGWNLEVALKAKKPAVEGLRCVRVGHMQHRNRLPNHKPSSLAYAKGRIFSWYSIRGFAREFGGAISRPMSMPGHGGQAE
jgi:hypothetical protein